MSMPEISEAELQAFVDGQLPEGRCTAVLAHFGRHPEDVQRLAAYARQKEELRARLEGLDQAAGDPVTEELQRALGNRLSRPGYGRWLRRAATVALLLAAGWSSHGLYEDRLEPHLPAVVVEAAQAHEVFGDDSQRPVELAAGARDEMTAWFSRHLGVPIEIPSLGALGLRLVGGRLLSGDRGPVAQLIYEDAAKRRLSLCLAAERTDVGLALKLVEVDGLNAGYWQEGDIAYALVAATPDSELVQIASELGAQEPADHL